MGTQLVGTWDSWSSKIIENPEWEKIREELDPDDYPEPTKFNLGGGLSVWFGEGHRSPGRRDSSELFMKLCWYVNNGPGYCEDAPEKIKILLRRLGVKV